MECNEFLMNILSILHLIWKYSGNEWKYCIMSNAQIHYTQVVSIQDRVMQHNTFHNFWIDKLLLILIWAYNWHYFIIKY